jgi:lysozyme family protein
MVKVNKFNKENILTKVMELEGKDFTDNKNDRGGPTKFGIIEKIY